MRKSLIVALIAALCMTGCAPVTQETEPMQKDMEQMIEKANGGIQKVNHLQNSQGLIDAPEFFQIESINGNLTVKSNAPLFVPKAEKFPILQVKKGDERIAEEVSFEKNEASHVLLRKGLVSALNPAADIASLKTAHIDKAPQQAYAEAEEKLRQINVPMIIRTFALVDDSSTEGDKRTASNYAYAFYCTRMEKDIPCAVILGNSSLFNENGEAIIGWKHESLIIIVNDDGIIGIKWNSPLEVIDAKAENCTLLPFSQIEEIFSKMIDVMYAMQAKENDALTLEIKEVRLEFMRVSENNSVENGLLVPAWNFYGIKMQTKNGKTDQSGTHILISINAVDGTVTDVQKGY